MYKECGKSLPTKYTHYDVIDNFCKFLEENNQMHDFVNLATGLIENKINPKNLAWQSALHMGQYSACPTTTVMRYEPEYIEFMVVMNLLFGSSALNILRGPAHFGSVLSGEAERSKYDPSESKCNFLVPSYKNIKNIDTGYPKVLKPGLIECTLDICEELTQLHQKQFVLSFDGMQVAPGSKGVSDDDVDLWGAEKLILNAQACSICQLDMDIVQSLESPVNISNQIVQSTHLKRLLWRFTKCLQQMRTHLTGEYFVEQKLEKLKDHNPDKVDRFDFCISHIFKNTTQIENCVSCILQLNIDICSNLGQLNGSSCCVAENKYVKLHKQPNFFELLPSEYVLHHMNLEIEPNTKYYSQYSTIWWKLWKKVVITGSTLYKGLGFETLKAVREHVNIFMKNRPSPQVPPDVQKYMEFGKNNEVHAISTLVGTILPALKLSCYNFYQAGHRFIHRKTCRNMIEVSPDGMIQCPQGSNCSYREIGDTHKRIMVEVKCLYPSDEFLKFLSYHIPVRHVPQVLAEIVACGSEELWLMSYTLLSITLILVQFNADLWAEMLNLCEEKYGFAKPLMPTKIHKSCKNLNEKMESFIKTNTMLLCEVPSLRGELVIDLPPVFLSPYAFRSPFTVESPLLKEINRDIMMLCDESRNLFQHIHDVLRSQATELLVFMINDKDELQTDDIPNSMPLSYALKGRCLSNADLCHLINSVRNKLKECKISILVECYDGQ